MHDLGERRRRLLWSAVFGLVAVLAACSSGAGGGGGAVPADPQPIAAVVTDPVDGATGVDPSAPIRASVTDGEFTDVALTNTDTGTVVRGALSADRRSFTVAEPLGYGATYRWSGTAVGSDGRPAPVEGSFDTVDPDRIVAATLGIADGQEVGIAAPIVVRFDGPIADRAAVEKALAVTTDPPTIGSWAWLPDGGGGARAHWRPQQYWVPGTAVHLDARLYGLDFGDGAYGAEDLTLDFTVGRSQVVVADATSHRMQVVRDGVTIMDIPVSYGQGNEARNVTRSGVHVVTEKHEDFLMSNPPYYENVRERWAVRISDNGEFIHANPATLGQQGATNVTNGCINLSPGDAQAYFATAMYGDPVEVSGTSIELSAADGNLYDWTIDWPTWQSMSAL